MTNLCIDHRWRALDSNHGRSGQGREYTWDFSDRFSNFFQWTVGRSEKLPDKGRLRALAEGGILFGMFFNRPPTPLDGVIKKRPRGKPEKSVYRRRVKMAVTNSWNLTNVAFDCDRKLNQNGYLRWTQAKQLVNEHTSFESSAVIDGRRDTWLHTFTTATKFIRCLCLSPEGSGLDLGGSHGLIDCASETLRFEKRRTLRSHFSETRH